MEHNQSINHMCDQLLQELHDARTLCAETLPSWINAASSRDLKDLLSHAQKTCANHLKILSATLSHHKMGTTGTPCKIMKESINDINHKIQKETHASLKDAHISLGLHQMQHIDMALSSVTSSLADLLKLTELKTQLQHSLSETEESNKKLSKLPLGKCESSSCSHDKSGKHEKAGRC